MEKLGGKLGGVQASRYGSLDRSGGTVVRYSCRGEAGWREGGWRKALKT